MTRQQARYAHAACLALISGGGLPGADPAHYEQVSIDYARIALGDDDMPEHGPAFTNEKELQAYEAGRAQAKREVRSSTKTWQRVSSCGEAVQ